MGVPDWTLEDMGDVPEECPWKQENSVDISDTLATILCSSALSLLDSSRSRNSIKDRLMEVGVPYQYPSCVNKV